MGANSGIEWTHHTFNPWRGCAKISPGCKHCYAEQTAKRNPATLGEWGPGSHRVIASEAYWRQPLAWDRAAAAAGGRHRVFCASLADVFEDRPDLVEPRLRLLHLIRATPHLDWLVLTKRAEFARLWMTALSWRSPTTEEREGDVDWRRGGSVPCLAPPGSQPLPNLWLGVSVEDQERAEERIPLLLDTPAAVRFLSCEPLLGPVDLNLGRCEWHGREFAWVDPRGEERCSECSADGYWSELSYDHWLDPLNGGIGWVIVGGESGPGARPMDLAWARSLVAQCQAARVPVFVKQLGARPEIDLTDESVPYVLSVGHRIADQRARLRLRDKKGGDPDQWPEDLRNREFPSAPALEVPPF